MYVEARQQWTCKQHGEDGVVNSRDTRTVVSGHDRRTIELKDQGRTAVTVEQQQWDINVV